MYGSEASVQALEEAIRQESAALAVERDGVRVSADALAERAQQEEALMPFAERLAALADEYSILAASHADAAAHESTGFWRNNPLISWVGSDRYRSLHRTYGAMIAERRVLSDRHEMLRSDLQAHVTGVGATVPQQVGRYQVAPQFYRRLEYAAQRQKFGDLLANMGAEP